MKKPAQNTLEGSFNPHPTLVREIWTMITGPVL